MAQPKKIGIDYFSINCDIAQEDKYVMLISECGHAGFGVFIRLLCELYRVGYCYRWADSDQRVFCIKTKIDSSLVDEVVCTALFVRLFHPDIYSEFGILTSREIQEQYVEACIRRREVRIHREWMLIEQAPGNVTILERCCKQYVPIMYAACPDFRNCPIRKESKVKGKESKVRCLAHAEHVDSNMSTTCKHIENTFDPISKNAELISVKNIPKKGEISGGDLAGKKPARKVIKKAQEPGQRAHTERFLDFVWLRPDEYETLCTRHSRAVIDDQIERLDTYIENTKNGRGYKNHFKVLNNWAKDKSRNNSKGPKIVEVQKSEYEKIAEAENEYLAGEFGENGIK